MGVQLLAQANLISKLDQVAFSRKILNISKDWDSSVSGQPHSVLDCLHCEHFFCLYLNRVLIAAMRGSFFVSFHCSVWLWLLCDWTSVSYRQHSRYPLTVLFSRWTQLLLTLHVLHPPHHLVESLLDSPWYVNVVLVLGSHIQLIAHRDSQSFSAKWFSG